MRIWDPVWKKFESRIWDGKKSDPGTGINIPDPQHWFFQVFMRIEKNQDETTWQGLQDLNILHYNI